MRSAIKLRQAKHLRFRVDHATTVAIEEICKLNSVIIQTVHATNKAETFLAMNVIANSYSSFAATT